MPTLPFRLSTLLFLLVLPACGIFEEDDDDDDDDDDESDTDTDTDADTDTDSDTDTDTDTDTQTVPPCTQTGVMPTAATWDLPGGFTDRTFDELADDSSTAPDWYLTDLDGDDLADIVLTFYEGSGIEDLGTSEWLVYENDGSGFSSSPTTWALPGGFPDRTFDEIADDSSNAPDWALLDVHGDGLADIVVPFYEGSGIAELGTTEWLVYENTGSGFASTPATWTLPDGFPDRTFDDVYDDSSTAPDWSLTDLDGDDAPDLIVPYWDGSGISGLGTTEWLVYLNTGTGFSATADTWTLPGGLTDRTFDHIYDDSSSAPDWYLSDLTHDGLPDIVFTYYEGSGISELGTTEWLVYDNDGTSGFAQTAAEWSLPEGMLDRTFDELADDSSSAPDWYLTSLDGSDGVDIVVTYYEGSGISGLGTTSWLLYTGECL